MSSPLSPMTKVARGATTVFVMNISSVVVGFFYLAILARLLVPYGMGILTILLMVSGFIMSFTATGLSYAPPKYLPQLLSRNRKADAAGFQNVILKLSLASSISLGTLLFLTAPALSMTLTGTSDNTFLFQLLAPTIVTGAVAFLAMGSLQGLQCISAYATIGFIYTAARRFIGLGLLAMGLGIPGLLYGWLIGDLIGIIPALRIVRTCLRGPSQPFPLRTLLGFSLPLIGYAGITFSSDWIDRLMLLALTSVPEVGIYYIAVSGSLVVGTVSTSIFIALYPQLSELHAKGGLEALGQAFPLIIRYFLLIFTPIIFGAAVFAYPIIWIFAGESYVAATIPFAILAVGGLGYQFVYIFNSLLMASGRTRSVFVTTAAAFAIFLITGFILVESLGMIGAAISKGISYTALLILTLYVLTKLVKLRADPADMWKPILASATATVITLILTTIELPITYTARYITLGILFIILYATILLLLKTLHEEDYRLIKSLLPKRLHPIIDRLENQRSPLPIKD